MNIKNQIILNSFGNSFKGFYPISRKWDSFLREIIDLHGENPYKYLVCDYETNILGAFYSSVEAVKFYNINPNTSVLVHKESLFI